MIWLRRLGQLFARVAHDEKDTLNCSFCGLRFPARQGEGVLGGRGFICRACIASCLEAIASYDHNWRRDQLKLLNSLDNK